MPHPASGEDVDIPDVVDDAARYPDGSLHTPNADEPLDYSEAEIPDVAGEVAAIAEREQEEE